MDTLNRVRYAGLDFETHQDEILARLQVKFASVYNDFAVSSLGIMLVDIFSFGLDTLSFYLDRRATDNFMVTTRTRSSAARLARQLGYRPGPASASSVDLQISLGATYAFPVTVPVGFQFQGPNGLVFESQESVTFSAGDTSTKTITASEGQTLGSTFFSDAQPNQVFAIGNIPSDRFIVGRGTSGQSNVIVQVDGEVWDEQEFLQFGDTNQVELGYVDSPPTVRFGDGIAGAIPPNGAEIRVSYFATSGVNGKATAGTITQVVRPLVVSFTQITLNVTNAEGSSGGSNPESLSSIKANAPSVFKSRGVNVTLEDYEARSKSFVDPVFGRIAVAKAISVRGSSDDAFLSSRLDLINTEAGNYVPVVNAATVAIDATVALSDANVDTAQTSDGSLQASIAEIITEEANVRTSNESSRTAAGITQVSAASTSSSLSSIDALISGIGVPVSGPSLLTATDRASLQALIVSAIARSSEISSQASTVLSNVTSATTALDVVRAKATESETLRAGVRSMLDSISTNNATITTQVAGLTSSVNALGNSITTYTSELDAHVDAFLSSECKSNLIEVPVLTLDSEGFYVVPTNGLQRSLQRHLDNGKEVTQVVKVTGVESMLVAADVSVLVGVLTGYNESTVKSQVEAAILNVLRGREFGVALRLSELYAPTAPRPGNIPIEGVEYVRVSITGPVGRVDDEGDIPVSDSEVITRGTITMSSEVVSRSIVGQ